MRHGVNTFNKDDIRHFNPLEEGRVRDNYGDKGGRDNDDCGMGITDNNMDDDNLSERGAPQHSIYRELVITWGTTR